MKLSATAVSQSRLAPQLGSPSYLDYSHGLWTDDYLARQRGAQSSSLQLTPTSSGTYYTPPPFTLLTHYGPMNHTLSGSHDENFVCSHPSYISLGDKIVDTGGEWYAVLSDPVCFLMGYRP